MKNIVMYSKGYCPYCKAAKAILNSKGLNFTEIDVTNNARALQDMYKLSGNRKTVPQIFFGDQHIGGHSDLVSYYKTHEHSKYQA